MARKRKAQALSARKLPPGEGTKQGVPKGLSARPKGDWLRSVPRSAERSRRSLGQSQEPMCDWYPSASLGIAVLESEGGAECAHVDGVVVVVVLWIEHDQHTRRDHNIIVKLQAVERF